ncbi:MAG: GTP pyrophosphokinase [Acidobacteria bacterium RIFCSPLOWO2_12_FULL_54_10]|nr:MAG: GTP pyrophosphokinase [Acidobacteria bacterium RIFCSPLOWO2_12_FULL_54_10]
MVNFPGTFRQTISTNLLTLTRFRELLKKIKQARPDEDLELLRRAYRFSAQSHISQTRASGEPYLAHPLEVAIILADMRMDVATIATALLHDVVEDTSVTLQDIRDSFGEEIALLVEGLTKVNRLDIASREERQADNLRKMFLAMVNDLRVIFIKLADRLHNMRTLQYVSPEKQQRIARETLEIYGPLAHRMGMSKVRAELEDLAFSYLDPIDFEKIVKEIEAKRRSGEVFLKEIAGLLAARLKETNIPARVEWRIKRPYSIFLKMKRQNTEINEVYDLLALRIVTDSVNNCYAALGVVHTIWSPVPGRFKDYIAMARPNLYQSLHTTVVGSNGQHFEVQIRTEDMHRTAEEGIAAHWKYKEGGAYSAADERSISWLRHLVEWQQELSEPAEFLTSLKINLYPEEVYAFSPKGKVVVLPRDSTTVDFAYAIHTEVGNTCVGAKVNGKLVPLRCRLRSGDIVEIVTQKGSHPSRDWLNFVVSSRARNKVRHWIKASERSTSMDLGRKILEKECRRLQLSWKSISDAQLVKAANDLGCPSKEDLFSDVGFGKHDAKQVLSKLFPGSITDEKPEKSSLAQSVQKALGLSRESAVQVKGFNDLLIYRAKCCEPILGDKIVGYITRGKGVAVHATNCPNVQNLQYEEERRIEVEWAAAADDTYPIDLILHTADRPGLLKEITAAISDKTNIRNIETKIAENGNATIDLSLDIQDKKHLDRLIFAMRKINGVRSVERSFKD